MKALLFRLRDEMGATGIASLVLLLATIVFYMSAVQPLQQTAAGLRSQLERQARQAPAGQPSTASEKLATFYRFLEKPGETTDWLAKLYAIGQATGVGMRSASYKSTASAGGRLERYEIVLPVTGNYAQIRHFLRRALAEIPVLSLDQLALKRETRNDGAVQAELRFTLHRLKP